MCEDNPAIAISVFHINLHSLGQVCIKILSTVHELEGWSNGIVISISQLTSGYGHVVQRTSSQGEA